MTNENLANQQQNPPVQQQQMSSSDYVKLLDTLFQREQHASNVEIAFELFEKNFGKNYFILNIYSCLFRKNKLT